MDLQKAISVLETTRLMFEMSLPLTDNDCDRDTIEAREDNEETIKAINEAIKALKRKPSTNADRPKAHWRKTALGAQCSFCLGFALFRVSASGEKEIESAFCPHCGADMKEGTHGAEKQKDD